MIWSRVKEGTFLGIKLENSLYLSHLPFMDDEILFHNVKLEEA